MVIMLKDHGPKIELGYFFSILVSVDFSFIAEKVQDLLKNKLLLGNVLRKNYRSRLEFLTDWVFDRCDCAEGKVRSCYPVSITSN